MLGFLNSNAFAVEVISHDLSLKSSEFSELLYQALAPTGSSVEIKIGGGLSCRPHSCSVLKGFWTTTSDHTSSFYLTTLFSNSEALNLALFNALKVPAKTEPVLDDNGAVIGEMRSKSVAFDVPVTGGKQSNELNCADAPGMPMRCSIFNGLNSN